MKDKEKLIRYFEASGNGEEARRMIDLAEQVQAGRPYRVTDFMSPAGLVIADAVKANFGGIDTISSGGYEGAERLRVAFVDPHFQGTVDLQIAVLKVSWDPRFRLLGSLMGLGIDRTHFGDIIVTSGGAQVIVDETIADFVIQNFTKIAMVTVTVSRMELSELQPKEEKIKEVRTTVASMRLDSIASSGFSTSRTKVVEAIKAGLVQVNWQPAKGPAQEVKEGDVISLRGRGRMQIESITGTSKKGRIGVHLKRFM